MYALVVIDEELREQILDNFEQSNLIDLKTPFNTTGKYIVR